MEPVSLRDDAGSVAESSETPGQGAHATTSEPCPTHQCSRQRAWAAPAKWKRARGPTSCHCTRLVASPPAAPAHRRWASVKNTATGYPRTTPRASAGGVAPPPAPLVEKRLHRGADHSWTVGVPVAGREADSLAGCLLPSHRNGRHAAEEHTPANTGIAVPTPTPHEKTSGLDQQTVMGRRPGPGGGELKSGVKAPRRPRSTTLAIGRSSPHTDYVGQYPRKLPPHELP